MALGMEEISHGVYRFTIFEGVIDVGDNTDIEAYVALNDFERKVLAKANPAKQAVHMTIGAETGAGDFTVTHIEKSHLTAPNATYDSAEWVAWEDLTDQQVLAAGEYEQVVSKPFVQGKHFHLLATVGTLGAGANQFAGCAVHLDVVVDDIRYLR